METSVQAQFLIPMAISLGFGVLFATAISLAIVPCGYLILEDIRYVLSRLYRGKEGTGGRPSGTGDEFGKEPIFSP
jgi:hypothetical protein